MEQTKNEPTKENKAAPETGKPKKEREPLTEAQRLKRQKMIVLPAMVLVFIGAMWLIFAPSSGKEQPPGTDGYSVVCDFNAYPYRAVTYATQKIIRQSNVTERSLVTTCRLLNASRSDDNPNGFTIEGFTIIENKDLQTIKR